MKIFREKSLLTKILILTEILDRNPSKLSDIAKSIGITPQAVSEYMRELTKENMVKNVDGRYRITKEGIEFLKYNLLMIKSFTEEVIEKIYIIDKCEAISRERIEKGDIVNLFMEDGYLVAYKNRESPSRGRALNDADIGDLVYVGDLHGIVEHSIGKLIIVSSDKEKIDKNMLTDVLQQRYDKLSTRDLRFVTTLKKMGKKIDFEFSPIEASIDALSRGLSVIFFGSREDVNLFLSEIEKFNKFSVGKIEYEVWEI